MPPVLSETTSARCVPVPADITVDGQTLRPVAVAMYGDFREVVLLSEVVDDGELYEGHTVLFARAG